MRLLWSHCSTHVCVVWKGPAPGDIKCILIVRLHLGRCLKATDNIREYPNRISVTRIKYKIEEKLKSHTVLVSFQFQQ